MNLRLFAVALAGLLSFVTAAGQNSRDWQSRYLEVILPPELRPFAGIEVPSEENIRVLSDATGESLEFRLVPGQAKKNNGIRAEVSVDYPYKVGDVVRYQWEMHMPEDFKADDPRNRWWVMGQWHDQPDRTKGESWAGFPGRSPPVSFNFVRKDEKDFLSLLVGSPRMKSFGLLPIRRGVWHTLSVIILWSQGPDGRVAVSLDGSKEPVLTATGPNMHNGYQHYLKLGMYRHPEIATENRLGIRKVSIEHLAAWPGSAQAADGKAVEKVVGMYVHQHWPYHHPYAARTWTLEDWRGYADGLHRLGYNAMLIWPVLETMPDPLTASDEVNLGKIAQVIDMLHEQFGMRAYIVLCPNVVAQDQAAAKVSFEKRHFFYCDARVDPGDSKVMANLIERRSKVLVPLKNMDGLTIIDSDPGGYPGSSNEQFVNLLVAHRKLLDQLRPGIELCYWMHVGWQGYGRFYETGKLSFSTEAEQLDMLTRLKAANPEPWTLANGLEYARKLGLADRVISFNYGRIEGEPSFPMSNFGGTSAYEGGEQPGPRGVMGNAQTHCVQLANTFAFARGAAGKPVRDADYVAFAEDLIPGLGETVVRAWKALASSDPAVMRACVAELAKIPARQLKPGPLQGLLFGSAPRFVNDLVMMLRLRAGFESLRTAVERGAPAVEPLGEFVTAAEEWQRQHGYENTWWWPHLDEVLRKLNAPEINTVLDTRFDPFAAPKLSMGESPFQYVARKLAQEESNTPRLLEALKSAWKRMAR